MNTSRNYTYRSPQEWEEIFKKFESSNLSKAAFCRAHGIKPSTFIERGRRHKKQLVGKETAKTDSFPDFIPVTVTAESFIDTKEDREQCITVTIGKASIALSPGFDPAFLKSIASTLAEIC